KRRYLSFRVPLRSLLLGGPTLSVASARPFPYVIDLPDSTTVGQQGCLFRRYVAVGAVLFPLLCLHGRSQLTLNVRLINSGLRLLRLWTASRYRNFAFRHAHVSFAVQIRRCSYRTDATIR